MQRKAWTAYLLAIHVLLAWWLFKSSAMVWPLLSVGIDPPSYKAAMQSARTVHGRIVAQVPAGSTVFLGDSLTAAFLASNVTPKGVSFGTGGQRSDHLLAALPVYKPALDKAERVFVMIGTNDVVQGKEGLEDRYKQILRALPNIPVVLSSIPPLPDYPESNQAADSARRACSEVPRCTFVDVHAALADKPGMLEKDRIHLSAAGYQALVELWRPLTSSSRQTSSPSP